MPNSLPWRNSASRLVIYFFNCFFLALIVYYVSASIGVSYLGLEGKFVANQWVINAVDQNGIGAKSGITTNDIVLEVDGKPLTKTRALEIWHRFIAKDSITIQKNNGEILQITIKKTFGEILFDFFPMIAVGLLFWLFGNYVLYSKPQWNLANSVYFFNYFIAIVLISIHAVSRNVPISRDLELMGILAAPPLLTYLIRVLPVKNGNHNRSTALLVIPGLVIFLIYLVWALFLWSRSELYNLIQSLILIYVVSWGIACTLSTLVRYHKSDQVTRNQIGIMLWCTVTGISPLLFLTTIPTLVKGTPILSIDYSIITVALIPLSMWYVLSKEKIFDLSFFVRHGTSYLILGFPALILYTWLLIFLYGSDVSDTWWKALTFLIFNITIVYIYSTWQDTLAALIEKQLFSDHYQRKNLLKDFQKTILKIHDPDLLVSSLLDIVSKSLKVKDLCLCLRENHIYYIKANRGKCKDKKLQAALLSYAGEALTAIFEPAQLPKLLGMEYAVPVLSEDGINGILFLGLKHSKIKFSQEDIMLVRSILDNFSIALENSKLLASTRKQFDSAVKEIASISKTSSENKWLNRMLVSAQEEERRKLSADLHDGPVQLLVQLIRNCEQFADTNNIKPTQFREKTLETSEIAKDILYDLRELCFKLRPSLLDDLGLIPTLEWWISEVKRSNNIEIDLTLDCKIDNVILDKEIELVLFRVVQEIVNNTLKHAQATNLNISLSIFEHRVVLYTMDNGIGFNTAALLDHLEGNRFGLLGMKKRVTWVGGTFILSSTPGVGTSIRVSIPSQPVEGEVSQWRA